MSFADPYDPNGPPEAARAAALALQAELPTLAGSGEGKMFGVLLAKKPEGGAVVLRAFSGMLHGSWHRDGFVPPLFDVGERVRQEARYTTYIDELTSTLARPSSRHRLSGLQARLRTAGSRALLRLFQQGYVVTNAAGERRQLTDLFVGGVPGGAGDCCAPKLLAEAYRRGLAPLALAEFYWGNGSRVSGALSPPCQIKCGPLLSFMLQGLDVSTTRATGQLELRLVHEDEHLLIVDKPAGLLSVPGKRESDSVQTRMRAQWPDALLAHRLDMDTSGLIVVAKDFATYVALQRQFAARSVEKRYVAWLEGELRDSHGTVSLPLRVDVDDRPRQIHDAVHGKSAVTEWHVLEVRQGRTRVALHPRTGRTHQLRVHAAHRAGLGCAIVGDRLYGTPGEQLLLHAETLTFTHPHTKETFTATAPAPW